MSAGGLLLLNVFVCGVQYREFRGERFPAPGQHEVSAYVALHFV